MRTLELAVRKSVSGIIGKNEDGPEGVTLAGANSLLSAETSNKIKPSDEIWGVIFSVIPTSNSWKASPPPAVEPVPPTFSEPEISGTRTVRRDLISATLLLMVTTRG